MNIGSLFVELGTKGAGSAIRQISNLQSGLVGASLAANQTIQFLKTMYESTSAIVKQNAQMGASLSNSSKELGISTDSLQRWEYAARLSNAKAGEMTASFRQLQKTLLDVRDGDMPQYFAYLFNEIGKVDQAFDADRFQTDLEYAMTSIRKLAKNGEYDLARLNQALASMGFSDSIANFLKLSDVDLSKISKDLIISGQGVKNLEEMNKGVVEIEQTMATAMADLAQAFDKEFINDIKILIKELVGLMKSLTEAMKESGLIKGAGSVVSAVSNDTRVMSDLLSGKVGIGQVASDTASYWWDQISPFTDALINEVKRLSLDYKSQSPVNLNINNTIQTSDDPSSIASAIGSTSVDAINNAIPLIQPTRRAQ